jgi:predicted acylesterase/phospholipase RssA
MTIKHLVISGGGPTGLLSYGAAKYLEQQKFWSMDNIESIYGTSIGALFAVILSLKHDWNTIDEYIIKCPWDALFQKNATFNDVLHIYTNKGFMSNDFFDIIMKPLLLAKDLSLDVTMKELYDFNKKEIHVMTVELNKFELINVNYKTHPSLKVMDAIKMSCAFPIIFSPKIVTGSSQKATATTATTATTSIITKIDENDEINDKEVDKEVDKRVYCYIDGGVMCNYPVNVCMEDQKCELDEILGFRNIWEKYNETIDDDSSLIDFLKICVKQMIRKIENENSYIKIKNEVSCVSETTDYTSWFDLCSDESKRIHYIHRGMTYGEVFLRLITKI